MTKVLQKTFILIAAGFVLAILVLFISPKPASAAGVCPNDGDWGISSGNSYNPGGLVVRTVLSDGTTNVNVGLRISTVDRGAGDIAGYSIVRNDTGFNSVQFVNTATFATGGTFYCGNLSDTYTGYLVLGFGSTRSNGNRWTLWCQEVTNTSGGYVYNNEEFKITNVAAPSGRSGYWTGPAGWNTGFTVTNGSTKGITLTWHDYPDLVIRNTGGGTVPPIISGPTTVVVGQSATYQARTRNAGAGTAAASTTKFSAGSSSNPQDLFSVGALASGTNSAVHSSTTSWSTAGTYTVAFTADNSGVVTEANESNNTVSLTVTVKAQPDLVIRNGTGGTSPAIDGPTTLSAGQVATYTARTKNVGTAAAAASTTRAWTTGSSNDSANFAVGALAASASSAVHTFTTSWNTPGNYTVSFKADNAGAVAESSEGNNTVSLTVIVRGVDLVIRNEAGGDTPAITGPATLTVGQSGTFTAITKNAGEGTAAASTTRASTTGSSHDSEDFPVGSLDTGKVSPAHSFTTSWNTPGNHTVTFKADNTGVVTESAEGNNTASITVNIPEPPPNVCQISAVPSKITNVDRTTTITAEGLDPGKQYRFVLSSPDGTVYANEIKTADAAGKVTYVQSFQYVDGAGAVKDLPEGGYKIEYSPLVDPSKKCVTNVTVFEVTYVEVPPSPVIPTPFGPVCGTAVCLAEAFLNTGLGVVGGFAFLLMVLGAYRLIFAGGNPDSVKSGREIITAAVLGLVVVVFAVFILNLIGIGILGINII